MNSLSRWLKRSITILIVVVFCLLSPVAYSEMICRPQIEPIAYQAVLKPKHHRPETRTLLTYPEWYIVHAYEDYARVLEIGDPHEYHFLQAILGFWRSVCTLSRASGKLGSIDSETKQMVYVIGISFTAELLAKAAYEETVGRLFTALRGSNRAALDHLSAEQAKNYAEFLNQVPWYKWDFSFASQTLSNNDAEQLRDRERQIALSIEYTIKAAYAKIIAAAVSEVGTDALTLRMIVDDVTTDTLETLKGVEIIGETEKGTEIETLRYRALTHLIQDMAMLGVEFVEIAGNDEIMFTVISERAEFFGAVHSDTRQGFKDYRHLILTKITDLASEIRVLESGMGWLEHVHDY